ncbi:fructose-1,6-bisphosphatase isozyme 2 [Selaginella moellendorffii]|uniref:fructose-1,6-bisphosphatase isozyme 2 n=1 Tax=Selaginella moellendorffii TaxID=88036 RepID=UPI000D1C4F4A|nr:fructose-1,6-bisphosphatase isozyme 2 [Selaginella moellendorffii]|eukprot:XP_024535626.1 fructose-1,6-bisphosphatase isozyme 2 [Selaginella moellendorffii]
MECCVKSLVLGAPPAACTHRSAKSRPTIGRSRILCGSRGAGISSRMVSIAATMSSPSWVDESATPALGENRCQSLMAYLGSSSGLDENLAIVILHLQGAVKEIAALLASPEAILSSDSTSFSSSPSVAPSSGRDAPKPLDIISNELLKKSLESSRKVAVVASEEEDFPVWIDDHGPFVAVFDPLDGSRNIDASIPTGTIFGIYRRLEEADKLPVEEKAQLNVLQCGSRLVASGYALYSSATILCLTVGQGTQIFMLDRSCGEFKLVKPDVKVPERGQIYSVNDARYFDWPQGLRRYIDDIRRGKGQFPKKYSARYVCSLVADVHRTILYGGIAMNPRSHLRLVYEGNPLGFLMEDAGGKACDGKRRILDIQPVELHQRLPLFLGSSEDVLELETYGDVQQVVNPGYEV